MLHNAPWLLLCCPSEGAETVLRSLQLFGQRRAGPELFRPRAIREPEGFESEGFLVLFSPYLAAFLMICSMYRHKYQESEA